MTQALDCVEMVLDLFPGRNNAWGGDEGRAIYGDVDEALIYGHLCGTQPIGIYPVRFLNDPECLPMTDEEQMEIMVVKWGCCDIDTGDWGEAYRLTTALRKMGLAPWVERSRSKGWHVWVFSDEWVPAYIMRRALKVAYAAIDLPAKEANPKSELLRPNQLGNYVRLPYKGALPDDRNDRQTFMIEWDDGLDGYPLGVYDFTEAYEHGDVVSSEKQIRHWASKWFEPPKALSVRDIPLPDHGEMAQLRSMLDRPLRTLFDNGPRARDNGEVDTSQGLMAIAYNTAKAGWTPEDVYKIVVMADHRWGKYNLRQNSSDYYTDIVERAFS